MRKIPILLLIFGVLLLQGCGSEAKKDSLMTFLQLHSEYCESGFKSAEQLSEVLRKDETFQANSNNTGIYEKLVGKVSYAISPEVDGCTTDLKIKESSHSMAYFSFEEIDAALIKKGYVPKGKREYRDEIGTDQHELKVVEQKYTSPGPGKVISTLVFPLESQDKYYMTLFAEKASSVSVAPSNVSPDVLEI